MADYQQIPLNQLGQGIKLSDIAEMGSIVPPGRYKVKLSRVEAKDSKQGNPMVVAGFDILDGTPAPDKDGVTPDINGIKGLEASAFYTMYVGRDPQSGRTIAPGIMEIKATCAAVGKPMDDDFIFPANVKDAARIVHDALHPKSVGELEAVITTEQDRKDKTKTRSKCRIIGRWGSAGVVDVPGAATPSTALYV